MLLCGRSERRTAAAADARIGRRPGAWAEDGETIALSARCRRVGVIGADSRRSSISAVSAVLTDTFASLTKHSCRAFATTSPSHGAPAADRYSYSPTALRAS